MKLTEELKAEIDSWTLEQLFAKHRFSPAGDPLYQGESGQYAVKRLSELRNKDSSAFVNISKKLG